MDKLVNNNIHKQAKALRHVHRLHHRAASLGHMVHHSLRCHQYNLNYLGEVNLQNIGFRRVIL
eukprot:8089843-Prorocentrum_lima.AAC.1